jgi:PhnB protein
MAKQTPSEKLDKIVERLLGHTGRPPSRSATRPAGAKRSRASSSGTSALGVSLIEVVSGLRGLPRSDFRARLKADLEKQRDRSSSMASTAKAVSEFRNAATPYLSIRNAAAALEFYKRAFGATEVSRLMQPDGRVGHAEINIGGARIMLADEFPEIDFRSPESFGGSPVRIQLEVQDVDAVVLQAVAAGARVVRPVQDQFYGERSGQLSDPFGYTWSISTTREVLTPAEMQRRIDEMSRQPGGVSPPAPVKYMREGFHSITPYLIVPGALRLIDFMKSAFGADEHFRVKRPGADDVLMHAEVKIGDSMIELADANPQYPPTPATLLLRVSDPDAVYNRAVEAGATPVQPMADQDYGTRGGTVRDASGNSWHIFTPLPGDKIFQEYRSVTPQLNPLRSLQLIEFFRKAFGGEEVYRAQSPDGVVHHAQVRIGDSLIGMGDAHGPSPALPGTFHLYVPDADSVYERALAAGAASIQPPADQPYGERNAGVTDPFGNRWFLATHLRDVQPPA